jgi:hypothetical protein
MLDAVNIDIVGTDGVVGANENVPVVVNVWIT